MRADFELAARVAVIAAAFAGALAVGPAGAQPAGARPGGARFGASERYLSVHTETPLDTARVAALGRSLEPPLEPVPGVSNRTTQVYRYRAGSDDESALEALRAQLGDDAVVSALPGRYSRLFEPDAPRPAVSARIAASIAEVRRYAPASVQAVVATPPAAVVAQLLRAELDPLADVGTVRVAAIGGAPTMDMNLAGVAARFVATAGEQRPDGSTVIEGEVLALSGRVLGPGVVIAAANGVQASFHVDGRIFDLRPVPAADALADATDAAADDDAADDADGGDADDAPPGAALLSEVGTTGAYADHSDAAYEALALVDAGVAASAASDSDPSDAAALAPRSVTLVVAYTPAAAALLGRINRTVEQAVRIDAATTNGYLRAQDVPIELELPPGAVLEVDYAEARCADHGPCRPAPEARDREALQAGVGAFAPFAALRAARRGDVAVLVADIQPQPGGAAACGIAGGFAAATPDAAVIVVDAACLNMMANYTVMHEIGHLLGAHHDLSVDPGAQPGLSGFVHDAGGPASWRDVMSYPRACNACQRRPLFSSKGCVLLDPATNDCAVTGTEAENAIVAVRRHAPRLAEVGERAWPMP